MISFSTAKKGKLSQTTDRIFFCINMVIRIQSLGIRVWRILISWFKKFQNFRKFRKNRSIEKSIKFFFKYGYFLLKSIKNGFWLILRLNSIINSFKVFLKLILTEFYHKNFEIKTVFWLIMLAFYRFFEIFENFKKFQNPQSVIFAWKSSYKFL